MQFKNKISFKFLIIISIFILLLGFITVQAFLNTDNNEVIPPDSFIKEGEVISLIEEDEKYYLKTENFTENGEYLTPATEKQIGYDEYAQIRSNGEYDILEKKNRHIINDVYVDEYYKEYRDGEAMAGNYIAEVLDGYFIPIEWKEFKYTQKVLINDGGIYYLATYHLDEDNNYTAPASYLLLSENQYNEHYINQNYDYIKEINWEISNDGNTIIKTIDYLDITDELIMRPIILQMTGFDNLEDYIIPEDIPDEVIDDNDDDDDEETPGGDDGKEEGSGKEEGGSGKPGSSDKPAEEFWFGSLVEFADDYGFFNLIVNWADNSEDKLGEGGIGDNTIEVAEGFYDDAGNFIEVDSSGNIIPSEEGSFDEDGNFTPEDGTGYYDVDGIWHPEELSTGEYTEDGKFETDEGTFDKDGNFIPDGANPIDEPSGSYDEDGNLITEDGKTIDKDGVIHDKLSDIELLDVNGIKTIKPQGKLTLNENGDLVIFGKDGFYDEFGLAYLDDGRVGYYNSSGRFFESRQNPNAVDGGFYDVDGKFHLFNTIYRTENNTMQTILYPDIGLTTDGLTLSIAGSSYKYSATGITTVGAYKGYFNPEGEFLRSDKTAYKGGFYDEFGRWIDDSLYKVSSTNNIVLSLGYFDSYGLYTAPNKDKGYFNEAGRFIINRENPYSDGYYNWEAKLQKFGDIYLDEIGNIHRTGSNIVITTSGQMTTVEPQKGILDKNKNWFNLGIVITPDKKIGHYNEFSEFKEGQIPYLYGYYDANGYFFRYDGIIISPDGEVGYFDESGNWVVGVKDGVLDANGNYVLPDGTVITPDGRIGYYDVNGNFIEGENPYAERTLPEGAYIDVNGNIVMPDGTIITPDGRVGYYDENGNFIVGESPYADGYYDADGNFHSYADEGVLDEKGNIILADGTVITEDGTKGYYDADGNFIVGESPYIDGYYDANGVWHEYSPNVAEVTEGYFDADGNWHSTNEEGYIDSNGNTILPNGVVINSDGTVGYYDENGVFHEGKSPYTNGYYDENGIWHPTSELPDGAYYDSDGNLIMPDGTVISSDGKVGYYDENGNFIEGANPYTGGHYNEDGEFIATGNYDADGNYIMSDGTIVKEDGTVILPNGTVVKGYVDENGKLIITENIDGNSYYDQKGNLIEGTNPDEYGFYDSEGNYHQYGDDGFYDEKGTYYSADGKVGYYDENGVFQEGANPYVNGFYDKDGNWHSSDGIVETVGYYDKNGEFHEGTNPYDGGYYDESGEWHDVSELGTVDANGNTLLPNGAVINPDGKTGYYDANGNFVEGTNPYDGGYYDSEGNWVSTTAGSTIDSNGNLIFADGVVISADGEVGYYDANGNFVEGTNPYDGGYYDSNGVWHSYAEEGIVDGNGNVILADGTVISSDGSKGYYDENGVWHEGTNPYDGGYYDGEGNWVSTSKLPNRAYYDSNGNLVMLDGTIIAPDGKVIGQIKEQQYDTSEPLVSYYDENGNLVVGKENPYEGGYYDGQGNWHSTATEDKVWIDKHGNAHLSSDGIGYYDAEGNFHLNNDSGHYTADGTYTSADGTIGYYDKDGKFHEGEKNPYSNGYYDSEGNWHPAGEVGYYDKDGEWHESVSNTVVGYYDEKGEFHEGTNPYVNGYYDESGNWHGEGEPITAYYDKDGNLITGKNPYTDGWYDSKGNWHPKDGEGYYDKSGTFHTKDGNVGYYDKDGIWRDGTNPYIDGYYDKDGNWHPRDGNGYYDTTGTYHPVNGGIGHYNKDGAWQEGQINPYLDGYYDNEGNWHPFNEDGYYSRDGVFHPNVYYNDKYQYGSSNYILFEGTFRTNTENAALRLAGNTVQFTINKHKLNRLYADTGIYVGLNSILEYEEAKDILHSIAISTKNTFVQDIDSCMLIYNGRIISISRTNRITVKKLKDLFKNTNIDIAVAKTRIGKKFALVEAIERNYNLKVQFDDKIITTNNPLVVIDNEAYISLNDISDLIAYDYSIKPSGKERKITFNIKNDIPYEGLRSYLAERIEMKTNDGEVNYFGTKGTNKTEVYTDVTPTLITLEEGRTSTYIPIKLVPRLTGCNAAFEANEFIINLNYTDGLPFIQQFYDNSKSMTGNDSSKNLQFTDEEEYGEIKEVFVE